MAKYRRQAASVLGKRIRQTHTIGSRMMAASATRNKTSVSGGSSFSTIPLKKNDPPHSTESTQSSDQSRASIRSSLDVIAAHVVEIGQTPQMAEVLATRFPCRQECRATISTATRS